MRQSRLIVLVASAIALVCLCLPAAALAGTYTWSLPGDFTASGANPDHDRYGTTPWAYLDGTGASSLSQLGKFETNVQGGLNGWSDTNDTGTLVGLNPQSTMIVGGFQNEDTFAAGQMVLEPTPQHVVAIRWTSPLSATVNVSGGIVSDVTPSSTAASGCGAAGLDTWSLDLNGSPVHGESGSVPAGSSGPQAISASVAVSPGDTVDLLVTAGASANGDSACAAAGATFQLQAPAPAPAVTLDQPASGVAITDGEPTFSGSAMDAFGDLGTVTLRVYRGTSVDASAIVQTLTATRSGAGYSIAPDPFLYDDTYTVQAEQDNVLGDHGFSAPVTFKLADPAPPIALDPLGARPLRTATPTLSGTAGTIDGDSDQIEVLVWAGTTAKGYPVRRLTAARSADGRWAIQVAPALGDGKYIAIAAQDGPAGLIGSQFDRFEVELEAPAVTLDRPAAGARLDSPRVVFSGRAGTARGDSSWITVLLYRGRSVSRRPIASARVAARRGRWSVRWHRKLAVGVYTVRALQRDGAGNVAWTAPRTFTIVAHRRGGV